MERAGSELSEELVMLRHGLVVLGTTHPPRNVHDLPRVQDGHIPRDSGMPFLPLEQVVLSGVAVVPRHMYPIRTRAAPGAPNRAYTSMALSKASP